MTDDAQNALVAHIDQALSVMSTAAELERRGKGPAEIRAAVERGVLIRVARGVFCPASEWHGASPADRLRWRSIAVGRRNVARAVVSHVSAAALYGLRLRTEAHDPHLTVVRGNAGRRGVTGYGHHLRHHSELRPADVVEVRGIRITTLPRTAADCAWLLPFRDAVVTVDSAFVGVAPGAVAAAFDAVRRSRAAHVRRVLSASDGRAGSVGESLLRLDLRTTDLPEPDLQTPVRCPGTTFFLDFSWRALGVGLEFDGLLKYTGNRFGSTAPADATAVVVREKRRESAIVAEGWEIARVMWDAVGHPEVTLREVRAAAARAGRRGLVASR